MVDDNELLDIVDEQDNIIGQDTKENKFKNDLISRNVAIFIVDDNKNVLIVKRSPNKKSFPNRFDVAACGNVKLGENFLEAAQREVKEELSINCDLKFIGKVFHKFNEDNQTLRYFTGKFLGVYSGEVKLNEELTEIKRLPVQKVEELINQDSDLFTPGFIRDFNFIKDKI